MPPRTPRVTHGRGRPPKYGRPSRAITVTLPDDVLARLAAIDSDLGRAIVSVVERRTRSHVPAVRPAELATYGNHAVIVVVPVKALRRLPGVQLVPIGNGRALISLDHERSVPQLELEIRDAMGQSGLSGPEREVLGALSDILRGARTARGGRVEQRSIIVLVAPRRRRSS